MAYAVIVRLASSRFVHAWVIRDAIDAATAVAVERGLRVTDAVPVGTGSNVIVHLRPAPVVARVMTGTVVLHRDPRAWLIRELDVATFLADRAPIVAPSREVDPGPYVHGQLWLSFWEFAETHPIALTAAEIGRALRALHDALAQYPGELPPRAAALAEIDWLLGVLAHAGDMSEFVAERDRLADFVRDAQFADGQPLHGDASLSNLLATDHGPRWNDFEDVCVGQVEWDVAGVLADTRERYGEAFSAELLAAYGSEFDLAVLAQIDRVHALYGTLWRRYHRRTFRR